MGQVYYNPGPYIGRITKQELSTASTGTPQFVLTVSIIDAIDGMGERSGVAESYDRYVYLYLSENAMEMTLKALKVLGFKKTSLKFLDPEVAGYCDFSDMEIPLWCKHESYEGTVREKWSVSTPREIRPVEAGELRKLDALFGRGLKEIAAGAEPSMQAKPNDALAEAAAELQGVEDIPF